MCEESWQDPLLYVFKLLLSFANLIQYPLEGIVYYYSTALGTYYKHTGQMQLRLEIWHYSGNTAKVCQSTSFYLLAGPSGN